MKNQPVRDQILTAEKARRDDSISWYFPAPASFAEEETLYESEDATSYLRMIASPETSLEAEIDPEEIESVYLWFYS